MFPSNLHQNLVHSIDSRNNQPKNFILFHFFIKHLNTLRKNAIALNQNSRKCIIIEHMSNQLVDYNDLFKHWMTQIETNTQYNDFTQQDISRIQENSKDFLSQCLQSTNWSMGNDSVHLHFLFHLPKSNL